MAAHKSRNFFSQYPESPKAYPEDGMEKGLAAFQALLNTDYNPNNFTDHISMYGAEVSPYLQTGIGVNYPIYDVPTLISRAKSAKISWSEMSVAARADVLIKTLDALKEKFFEIAYATMHTTGQSFMMSFQASGPHANDRALEVISMGYEELTRFSSEVEWTKSMGKFDLVLKKNFKAIPKGISLVIGCSTFPTWNTVPGLYASLITGNPVIVKPHPKAVLPIAIYISEIQRIFIENGIDPFTVQLAADTMDSPVTKVLAENKNVKLIDYTGNSPFGNYIESLNKTCFTEKSGINSVILDSANDINAVAQNLAFSVSLYSGQMCTAPQNIYIAETGIETPSGIVSFDEFVEIFATAVKNLALHPKSGPGTLGAIQNEETIKRVKNAKMNGATLILDSIAIANPEFENARTLSPAVLTTYSESEAVFMNEYFGPIVFVVKTKSFEESLELTANSAAEHGAITCLAYCIHEARANFIEETMNNTFTPVSFNFTGAAFVNQHAAFSDFHVTGGNPAGNASFTSPEFITKRFVWVGNRFMS